MSPEQVTSAAFDVLEQPLCIVSNDGTVRRANDALRALAGRDDVDGESARSVFSEDAFETALGEVFAEEDAFETALVTTVETDGGKRSCELTLTRLSTDEPLVLIAVELLDDRPSTRIEDREAAYREMYEVIADREKPLDEQVSALLEIGCHVLGTKYGTLSHAEGDQYVFEIVHADDGAIEAGHTIPLSATVCERTVSTERTVVIRDLAVESPDQLERSGVQTLGLACYLGAPVFVDDEVYGTFCFYSDESKERAFEDWEVTLVDLMSRWVGIGIEQQRTEARLRRENGRLERLASVISHDLRNPLSVAKGRLDLVAEEHDSEHLDDVATAHDRMEELISDILTLTREGEAVDETESVDLASVSTDAWSHVITDEATLVTEETMTLQADRSRLAELFENLYRNSVEHAGEDVTVTVGGRPDGFYVEDDGPGVPEDIRDEVFEPGRSTRNGGTGFGLTIVREIVEAHDWRIEIGESEPGGARFEVSTGDPVDDG